MFADHVIAVASNLNGNCEVKYDIFKTTLKVSFPTPSVFALPNAISLYCLEKLLNTEDTAVVLLFWNYLCMRSVFCASINLCVFAINHV